MNLNIRCLEILTDITVNGLGTIGIGGFRPDARRSQAKNKENKAEIPKSHTYVTRGRGWAT
jgi:hypothetical protein